MRYLALSAPAFAMLLFGAHVFRGGPVVLVVVCLGLAGLVFVRHRWVPRVLTVALVVATAEWLRTLYLLAAARLDAGQPLARLAVILGVVAIATAASALVFRLPAVRGYYHPGKALPPSH